MLRFLLVPAVAVFLVTLGCGGGGGGSGPVHALAGTWTGPLVQIGTDVTVTIDASGLVTAILMNGVPSTTYTGGSASAGPEYTLTLIHDSLGPVPCPFLVDTPQEHGALVLVAGPAAYVAALERDAVAAPIYFEDDVIGSWTGYGTAYDQPTLGFKSFSPVTTTVTAANPDNTFSTTFPGGTITGAFDIFALGRWSGTANVTGATVILAMTHDKQFVAVEAISPGASGLEDFTFFAMNRD